MKRVLKPTYFREYYSRFHPCVNVANFFHKSLQFCINKTFVTIYICIFAIFCLREIAKLKRSQNQVGLYVEFRSAQIYFFPSAFSLFLLFGFDFMLNRVFIIFLVILHFSNLTKISYNETLKFHETILVSFIYQWILNYG